MNTKCKTCLGEYNKICPDKLLYFHVCPDITDINGKISERINKRDENIKTFKEGLGIEIIQEK